MKKRYYKASKAAVNYTPKAMKRDERCGLCRYYIEGGECKIVKGDIESEGWCEEFERAK